MRILVLGGTAFLSAEIVRQAVAGGHRTACLARGTAGPPPGAGLIRADRSLGANAYLAGWILFAAEQKITGALNALGEQVPFGEYFAAHGRRQGTPVPWSQPIRSGWPNRASVTGQDQTRRGLDRPRKAGLMPATEARLLAGLGG